VLDQPHPLELEDGFADHVLLAIEVSAQLFFQQTLPRHQPAEHDLLLKRSHDLLNLTCRWLSSGRVCHQNLYSR
jgi:hypothetical protein